MKSLTSMIVVLLGICGLNLVTAVPLSVASNTSAIARRRISVAIKQKLQSSDSAVACEAAVGQYLDPRKLWNATFAQREWDNFHDAWINDKYWRDPCRGKAPEDCELFLGLNNACKLRLREASKTKDGEDNIMQALNLWSNLNQPGRMVFCGADQPSCTIPDCTTLRSPTPEFYLIWTQLVNANNIFTAIKRAIDEAEGDVSIILANLKREYGPPPARDNFAFFTALGSAFLSELGYLNTLAGESEEKAAVGVVVNQVQTFGNLGLAVLNNEHAHQKELRADPILDANEVFLGSAQWARATVDIVSQNLFQHGMFVAPNSTTNDRVADVYVVDNEAHRGRRRVPAALSKEGHAPVAFDISHYLKSGIKLSQAQLDPQRYLHNTTTRLEDLMRSYWDAKRVHEENKELDIEDRFGNFVGDTVNTIYDGYKWVYDGVKKVASSVWHGIFG